MPSGKASRGPNVWGRFDTLPFCGGVRARGMVVDGDMMRFVSTRAELIDSCQQQARMGGRYKVIHVAGFVSV